VQPHGLLCPACKPPCSPGLGRSHSHHTGDLHQVREHLTVRCFTFSSLFPLPLPAILLLISLWKLGQWVHDVCLARRQWLRHTSNSSEALMVRLGSQARSCDCNAVCHALYGPIIEWPIEWPSWSGLETKQAAQLRMSQPRQSYTAWSRTTVTCKQVHPAHRCVVCDGAVDGQCGILIPQRKLHPNAQGGPVEPVTCCR
jgi:hypothetical protein